MSDGQMTLDPDFEDEEELDDPEEKKPNSKAPSDKDDRTKGKSVPEHYAATLSAIAYSHIRKTPGRVPRNIFEEAIIASFYPKFGQPTHRDISIGIRKCLLGQFHASKQEYTFVDVDQVPPPAEMGRVAIKPISIERLERLYRHERDGTRAAHPGMLDVEPGEPFPEAIDPMPTIFLEAIQKALRAQKVSKKATEPAATQQPPSAPPPPPPKPLDAKQLALAALAMDDCKVLIPYMRAFTLILAVLGDKVQAEHVLDQLDLDDSVYLSGGHVILPLASLKLGRRYIEREPNRFGRKA